MRILAVDTTFAACSAALLDGGRVMAHRFVPMERGHAEALAPMVDAVMREAGTGFRDLERLAVTTGPGTFTGQRVGLAFMRGLRLALERPLTGITSLAAMVEQARAETGLPAAAIQDARREEVYIECDEGGSRLMPFVEAVAALAGLAPRWVLAGTAASRTAEALQARRIAAAVSPVTAPDAVWVARLAARLEPSGEPVRPLYLRAPDAKLPSP